MATVTKPKPFNHEETHRRVKSPLQLVRKVIRRYIILEGLALVLLAAAVLFWVGLALDFGLFKFDFDALGVHGIDWILVLNDVDTTGNSSLACRVIFLLAIVAGLFALGFYKVGLRWFREFNDRAVALVLERRFPRELGDRLITAVELADPKLSKKYGYSQAMVEKTIQEAVQALKKLPVTRVFNWRRLYVLWGLVGIATFGLLFLTAAAFCGGSLATDSPMGPYGFGWKFFDTASIWTERNVLMMKTYWPRRAHLEIERFQPSAQDKSDMRVPMSDERPTLTVRAYEWVIADRNEERAPYGWRPLTWKDLSERKLIDAALLDNVKIPRDFGAWQVDPDELEPNLAAALFGTDTRTRPSSEVRAALDELKAEKGQVNDLTLPWEKRRAIKAVTDPDGAEKLRQWLDWTEWSIDKLAQEKEDKENVRPHLRDLIHQQDHYEALAKVFDRLEEIAEEPSMARTVRKLELPEEVVARFVGDEKSFSDPLKKKDGSRYEVSLASLAESPKFRFRARAENYTTPPKTITLVAAPAPATITIDKDEPAYIYHRLHGADQTPLKGVRHETRDLSLPTTGELNTIEVPLGSDLTIHVRTDRPLRQERSIDFNKQLAIEAGYDAYRGLPPSVDPDRGGFKLVMTNLARKHDFTVEFFDEDNIRGKRRFKILSVLDMEPQLGNLNITGVLLRKPKFKAPTGPEKGKDKDKTKGEPERDYKEQAELANAYLITPDALLPFECPVKDDYGLTSVGYNYKVRRVDVELMSQGGGEAKVPLMQVDQVTRRAHAVLVATNFQYLLGNPIVLGYHVARTAEVLEADVRRSQGYREGYVACDAFKGLLERKFDKMIYLDNFRKALSEPAERLKLLRGTRSSQPWEFDFKEDDGFDVKKHLPNLKAVDLEKTGQQHYYLQIAVEAVDNNVETGKHLAGLAEMPGSKRTNRNGYIGFLVISENELLTQISLEEEMLTEKLEGAKEKVDAGIVSLKDQLGKVANPKTDMDNVLNRMNEIRTALAAAGNTVEDAKKAYDNIVREMEVNRVREDRIKKIKERIAEPLKDIVIKDDRFDDPKNPQTGSLDYARSALENAHQIVEDDVNFKREPNYAAHRAAMDEADRKLRKLSLDIKRVLDAMSEGIVESKLIALIAAIEEGQRKKGKMLELINLQLKEILLKELLKDLDPVPPPPKKDEKKSSQMWPQRWDGEAGEVPGGPRTLLFSGAIGPTGASPSLRIVAAQPPARWVRRRTEPAFTWGRADFS